MGIFIQTFKKGPVKVDNWTGFRRRSSSCTQEDLTTKEEAANEQQETHGSQGALPRARTRSVLRASC